MNGRENSAAMEDRQHQAERFLQLIDEEAEVFCFQTFDDDPKRKAKRLAQIRHGALPDLWPWLETMNAKGAGIFVTVNETDGAGRKAENIRRVRAVFADFDPPETAPPPVKYPLPPAWQVESSPGKRHAYWPVDDLALEDFPRAQKAIINTLGSDPVPQDLPRVMRLPGFRHVKNPAQPHWVRLFDVDARQPYHADQIFAAFAAAARSTATASTAPAREHGDYLSQLVAGENIHDNALRIIGRLVREQVSRDVIKTVFQGLSLQVEATRGADRAACLRGSELERMINGAFAKGYDKQTRAVAVAIDSGPAGEPPPIGDEGFPWPDPVDIAAATEAALYPLHAFPPVAQTAIAESAEYRQAPLAMSAGSALFQMAMAAQGLADVARDSRLIGPLSLYLMFFAASGARKTATDKDFGRAHKAWVRREREKRIDDYRRSLGMVADYQEDLKGVKDAIKKLAPKNDEKSQKEKERLRERLIELQQNPKFVIPMPSDLHEEYNPASLSDAIAEGWPSSGTASDEAGIVIGSQGFSKENATGMLALLNRLWGADDYIQTRKSVRAAHVRGRRFSTNLMMQPSLLATMIDRGARDLGYLARFLIASPPSTMGTRFYREPPEDWPAMDAFEKAITVLLEQSLPVDTEGDDHGAKMILKPPIMRLSPQAKRLWIDFHDAVERELCQFGEFASVADVASKSAENAVRVAGVFSLFDRGRAERQVEVQYMEGGIAVAGWHLHEAKRLFLAADATPEETAARELSTWLTGKGRELANRDGEPIIDREGYVSLADISHKGPNCVRDTTARDNAIDRLAIGEAGHVRRVDQGKRKLLQVNPKLAIKN